MKILLLKGGDSPEREISLKTAQNVSQALKNVGHEVDECDPIYEMETLVQRAKNADEVFIAIHGRGGEDGVLQELLEENGVFSYLGADPEVSKLSFDKVLTHKKLESAGIVMPRYEVVSQNTFDDCKLLKKPFVMKPIQGGSSIDTIICRDVALFDTQEAKNTLGKYKEMLVEELINGKEIHVAVVGSDVLPPVHTIPPDGEEFDYRNKYNGRTQELCPIPKELIADDVIKKTCDVVKKVHDTIGARHLSRTDCIITDDGDIYVLEINTIPGMTSESLLPKSACAAGMDMDKLTQTLVELIEKGDFRGKNV